MRLARTTDTHLDRLNRKGQHEVLGAEWREATHADALLITGDIATSDMLSKALKDVQRGFGAPVYFVLGNHDYYGQSFANVHDKAKRLTEKNPGQIVWLTDHPPIELSPTACLIGVDGWYDARCGHCSPPKTSMTDFRSIKDLARHEAGQTIGWGFSGMAPEIVRSLVAQECRQIADRIAEFFKPQLRAAAEKYPHVVIATHVPPFPQNATYFGPHRDYADDGDWLPWYTNKALGDLLMATADDFPNVKFDVLCGHAHWNHDHQIIDNLRCRTLMSEYGHPVVEVLTF